MSDAADEAEALINRVVAEATDSSDLDPEIGDAIVRSLTLIRNHAHDIIKARGDGTLFTAEVGQRLNEIEEMAQVIKAVLITQILERSPGALEAAQALAERAQRGQGGA